MNQLDFEDDQEERIGGCNISEGYIAEDITEMKHGMEGGLAHFILTE